MSVSLLESLNPSQREAVEHVDGPLLILAGPGSGKTRVVTHRIAHLLSQGIRPRDIVAVTFTNKAADEMRQRLAVLAPDQPVWVGTFHRFCSQLLRRYADLVGLHENFSILDVDDSRKLLTAATEDAGVELSMMTPEKLASAISWAKNNLVTPEQYLEGKGGPWDKMTGRIYDAYQRRLLTANAVDFDDLLMRSALLLRDNPELRRTLDQRYRYILVDEYQDTNLAQYALVRALSIDYPNLAVTGDPDQSIYGWRGANLSNILEFEHDYPSVKVVRLEHNYRSTANILHVADTLIAHNVRRKEKTLTTHNPPGPPVRLVTMPTQRDEADAVANRIAAEVRSGRRRPRDFAVFYRVNALSRAFEHAMMEHGVPYQIVHGVEFYQRKEVKDLLAYLHLINNPQHDVALLRVINTPTRGIGKTTIQRIAEFARRKNAPLLAAARSAGVIEGINSRAALAVARFVTLYDQLRESATAPVEEILGRVLEATGYREHLAKSAQDEEGDRLANVEELLTAARQFDSEDPGSAPLERFLEQAALVNDTDDWEGSDDKVTLMTLHGAKGLEFPVVFIVALEEGLIPHERSSDDSDQIEEERRLLFVGLTRAREELQLSYANYRQFRGMSRMTVPSSFLMELPRSEMEISEPNLGFDAREHGDAFEADAMGDDAWDFDPGAEDDDAVQFDPEDLPSTRSRPTRSPPPAITSRLTTAASLLSDRGDDSGRIGPDDFALGMLVRHPEYGTGRIVALSGEGPKRQAIVRFSQDGSERTFRLQFSPLYPVSGS